MKAEIRAFQSIGGDDRKKEILLFLSQNSQGTSTDFSELLGLSQARTRVILQEMVSDNLIEKRGTNRYTRYVSKIK